MLKYPYSRANVTKKDIKDVIKVLESQYLTQGKIVKNFEKKIESKLKVKQAIVCNSGTAALHSVYRSIGLNKKNGLITTPITFLATANAARMCNAPVYFCDVDSESGLITPDTLEKAFKNVKFKVKAVTLVHLGGHICDLEGIYKVAKKNDCLIIEDACHAIGANYYSKKNIISPVGSCKYSIASTFSFHAIKNITMGEGGCVTTNDLKLAEKIRLNISHGMTRDKNIMIKPPRSSPWYYQMKDIGWNYRASDISCALGLSQFSRIDKIIKKRRLIAKLYKDYLIKNKEIKIPNINEKEYEIGWHLFQLSIDFDRLGKKKEDFINYLKNHSIGSQVHYIPLVYQPYYSKFTKLENLKGAVSFYNKTISIPMYTGLSKKNVKYITNIINNFFN